MRSIWSFAAPPTPATACFTWFGEYSTTSHPAATASAMARPAAWATGDGGAHVDLEQHPLDGHHRRAGARASSARRSTCSSARRSGVEPDGSVRSTPTATARVPDGSWADEAVAAAGQPRVDAEDEHAFDRTPSALVRGADRATGRP